MFFEVMLGRVANPERLRRQWESWVADVAPGAVGWLGSTGGITGDGRAVVVHRFASREAAEANGERPDHDTWWSGTKACMGDPVSFVPTGDVTVVLPGPDLATAGFVQAMHSAVRDRQRLEQLEADIGPAFFELRPDVVGGYRAWAPDGTVVAVDYFRSEAEARAGESLEMSASLQAGFQEWLSLLERTEWFDLTDPWHAGPS